MSQEGVDASHRADVVRDQQLTRITLYQTRSEALRAAGLAD